LRSPEDCTKALAPADRDAFIAFLKSL